MPVRSLTSSVLKWPDAQSVDLAVRKWALHAAAQCHEITRIGYFGSYATGNWGVGSDIDLVIVIRGSKVDFERKSSSWDTTVLPVPSDVLIYTEEEWESLPKQGKFSQMLHKEIIWLVRDSGQG